MIRHFKGISGPKHDDVVNISQISYTKLLREAPGLTIVGINIGPTLGWCCRRNERGFHEVSEVTAK